jgi:hypothetical protein
MQAASARWKASLPYCGDKPSGSLRGRESHTLLYRYPTLRLTSLSLPTDAASVATRWANEESSHAKDEYRVGNDLHRHRK